MSKDDSATFGGTLSADCFRINMLEFNNDVIFAPDTLHIRMTRGERRVTEELRKAFGGFERVVIDVDGERHEFSADSLIRLLEGYEDKSRWHELFGTPERAARTLVERLELGVLEWCNNDNGCDNCPYEYGPYGCEQEITLLEWLRGEWLSSDTE